MKKTIILILAIASIGLMATIKPNSYNQTWHKLRQYFSLAPILLNSGGTPIDTLTSNSVMRAYVAAHYGSGGSMTYPGAGIPWSTGSSWGTSIDTVQLKTAIPQLPGLDLPKYTTAQRNAISNPATFKMIGNLDTGELNYYDGITWRRIPHE